MCVCVLGEWGGGEGVPAQIEASVLSLQLQPCIGLNHLVFLILLRIKTLPIAKTIDLTPPTLMDYDHTIPYSHKDVKDLDTFIFLFSFPVLVSSKNNPHLFSFWFLSQLALVGALKLQLLQFKNVKSRTQKLIDTHTKIN